MNLIRLVADLMHLASILILLLKITQTKSVSGISFKTQVLYLVVFVSRYLNLFFDFISLYNSLMKIFFIGTSAYIVYLMYFKFRTSYNASDDLFRAEYLAAISFVLALLFHETSKKYNYIFEIIWAFSIYLESVAILPQLFMLTRKGEADTITTHYLFALGVYRGLYILNWIYRYIYEHRFHYTEIIAGLVQTALYADFFYIYITKVVYGKKFKLPV